MACLIDAADRRRVYPLVESQVLGREPGCDIVLDDPQVSRQHAVLRRLPDGVYRVTDLNSRGGLFVDGERVTGMDLREGAILMLGSVRLAFETQRKASAPLPVDAPPAAPQTTATDFAPIRQVRDMARLRLDYERLRAAHEVTMAVGTEQRPERIASRILDAAFSLLPAERGIVVIFKPQTTDPLTQTVRVRNGGSESQVSLSSTLLEEVVASGKGLIASDVTGDERLRRVHSLLAVGLRSLMCVPLMHEDKAYGVMQLDCSHATHAFHEADLELFTMIGGMAALSLAKIVLRGALDDVREEERLRLLRILDMLPMGVALVQRTGQVHAKNAAAEAALRKVARFKDDRLTHVGDRPLQEVLMAGQACAEDLEVGGLIYSAYAQTGEPGPNQDAVLIVEDVTQRRLDEERRARADRLAVVGQMASGIAHDFNNLMTVVNEGAGYLMRVASEPDSVEEAEAVVEAGRRATRLVRQLLTFSRRDPVRREPLDLSQAIDDMSELLQRALTRMHRLEFDLAPDLPMLQMDRGHVDQLVMNLVVNGRDAMKTPGTLVIRTRSVGMPPFGPPNSNSHVVLVVEDSGCGMSEDLVHRVFEPFFTTKPVGKGTGLGLATVHGIVEGLRGTVNVHSVVGRGTRFEVSIPVLAKAANTRDLEDTMERKMG